MWQKDYGLNPATCSCENEKYLARFMNDSANICDKVIDSYNEDVDAEAKSNDKTNFNDI